MLWGVSTVPRLIALFAFCWVQRAQNTLRCDVQVISNSKLTVSQLKNNPVSHLLSFKHYHINHTGSCVKQSLLQALFPRRVSVQTDNNKQNTYGRAVWCALSHVPMHTQGRPADGPCCICWGRPRSSIHSLHSRSCMPCSCQSNPCRHLANGNYHHFVYPCSLL